MTRCPVLGVLVPCRNEAAVLARKLRNLALLRWPAAARPHRVIVIDDGSEDGTAELADRLIGRGLLPDDRVRAEVVANAGRPGKAGAIATGLEALGTAVDVVVLTDADVIFREDAVHALADAFAAADPPGMACGSQEFVEELADDGTPTAPGGGVPIPAPGRYDRWTAAVRRFESRSGRLFSVHGQLLAWQRALDIAPTPGIAADDLDLMRQVRARRLPVVKLHAARFLEVKTPAGPDRRHQQLRRARAYVQVIGSCRLPAGAPLVDRMQFALYRLGPTAAPWLVAGATLAIPLLAGWLGGAGALTVAALVLLGIGLSPPGRQLSRLLGVIARAHLVEARSPLGDRWEMPRRVDAPPPRRAPGP